MQQTTIIGMEVAIYGDVALLMSLHTYHCIC